MDRYKLGRFLLVSLLQLAWFPVVAAEGRDFAGFFAVTNVVESEESVALTFSVRLHNFGGADLLGARVRLVDPFDLETDYEAFMAVDIRHEQTARLIGEVIVPRTEWDAWSAGASPWLIVEYQDPAGDTRLDRAELVRSVVGEDGP